MYLAFIKEYKTNARILITTGRRYHNGRFFIALLSGALMSYRCFMQKLQDDRYVGLALHGYSLLHLQNPV